ncbi:MAG: hypothetical protein Q9222_007890 [Ikaeria aurantiellina]
MALGTLSDKDAELYYEVLAPRVPYLGRGGGLGKYAIKREKKYEQAWEAWTKGNPDGCFPKISKTIQKRMKLCERSKDKNWARGHMARCCLLLVQDPRRSDNAFKILDRAQGYYLRLRKALEDGEETHMQDEDLDSLEKFIDMETERWTIRLGKEEKPELDEDDHDNQGGMETTEREFV